MSSRRSKLLGRPIDFAPAPGDSGNVARPWSAITVPHALQHMITASAPSLVPVAACPRGSFADEPPLAREVAAVLRRPEYKHARWGILVVDAATGKPVFEHNADQLFAPASVTKLYSCAAALVALGADHRFETPVYRAA